jgi:vacuolar-type H+-ATPase subunit H
MSDSGMKERVLGLLGSPHGDGPAPPMEGAPHDPAQHEALRVLTLAQRTAEEYVAGARNEADRICGEARDRAAHIVRDAQAHAEARQREAEAAVSKAHAAAAQIANDAQARADHAQQEADEILSDARMRADELVKIAQARADELHHLAEQRYEDVVGSLATKRESLQEQIEALEQFDREYRARLQAFMQHQLRALWVDEPRVHAEDLGHPDLPPTEAPAQPDHAEQFAGGGAADS